MYLDTRALKKIQKELAGRVSLEEVHPDSVSYVLGMDVSYMPFDSSQMIYGAAVLLSYPSLEPLETVGASLKQTLPYITGLLAFREVPVLVEAFQKLTIRPDLILVDGHGICHPRGLGIASHLGVLLDIPTIGVAKSILIGKPVHPLKEEVASQTSLYWKQKEVGRLVRTKKGCLPLVISPGHKVSMEQAVAFVLECTKTYRLPEPTRYAHNAANSLRKNIAK